MTLKIFYLYQKKTRTKREAIRGAPEAGCSYVFADGSADARDLKGPEYVFLILYLNPLKFLLTRETDKQKKSKQFWKTSTLEL